MGILRFRSDRSSDINNYRQVGLKTNPSNYGWYTCVHCGRKLRKDSVEIDHILPRSKGGENTPENLQCLCKYCNRSKGNKTDQSKDDLQLRKKSYSQYKRSEILKPKLCEARKKVNSFKHQLNDADIVEMLNTELIKSDVDLYNSLKTEAKRRGIEL